MEFYGYELKEIEMKHGYPVMHAVFGGATIEQGFQLVGRPRLGFIGASLKFLNDCIVNYGEVEGVIFVNSYWRSEIEKEAQYVSQNLCVNIGNVGPGASRFLIMPKPNPEESREKLLELLLLSQEAVSFASFGDGEFFIGKVVRTIKIKAFSLDEALDQMLAEVVK